VAKDEDVRLFDLLEREQDPELKRVLEHYRGAEIEMQCAAELLGRMQRIRWELAAQAYARDIELQAQRHMAIERARKRQVASFRDDVPTNPVGYPPVCDARKPPPIPSVRDNRPRPFKITPMKIAAARAIPPLPAGYSFGTQRFPAVKLAPKTIEVDLNDLLPADTIASDEAVFDTERPPAVPDRYVLWVINVVLTTIIVFTLWLLRREVTMP